MPFDASVAYDDTKAFITSAQTMANNTITKLTNSGTMWASTSATIRTITDTLADASTVPQAAGTKPNRITLDLPAFVAADFTPVVAPALPAAPSIDGGNAPLWNEAYWTNLKTLLTTFTSDITGADDVDSVVTKLSSDTDKLQVALYAKDYERRTQVLRDLYSAADASTGARGFSYPNSMTTALKLDAQQKFQFDMSQVARDLTEFIFKWAKENWQFAATQQLAAHNADVEFNVRYLDTTVKVYVETVNALVTKYRADLEIAAGKARVKVEEYLAQVNALVDKNRLLEDARIKEAAFDLDVARTNAESVHLTNQDAIENFRTNVGAVLDKWKIDLADMDANVKNQISAATSAATAATALASAAATITVNTGGA